MKLLARLLLRKQKVFLFFIVLFSTYHEPDWFIEITVSCNAFSSQCSVVVMVVIIVATISSIPHSQPFVRSRMVLRDPTCRIVRKYVYCITTWGRLSRVTSTWAVFVEPVNIPRVVKFTSHQKLLKIRPSPTRTRLFVDNPDFLRITEAEHNFGPVRHTWVYLTSRVNIGLSSGLGRKTRLYKNEWGSDLGRD